MTSNGENRAYIVGRDGHFIGSRTFVAANDDAAFEHARKIVDGHDVELWSGERFVVRLDHKSSEKT
jgi:hypothetical protein